MSQVYLFQLAASRVGYLSARQTLIAENVANANTPAYRALDLKPFAATLDETAMAMATTDPAHLTPAAAQTLGAARAGESEAPDATVSGNSVEVENEMMKLGEVARDFSQATAIRKVFHQMMMQALK